MSSSIIVVGAGIAGLSTGCYAQMNGYRTRIFELHDLPGGLCTSWKRNGYVFDGCVEWLVGSAPGNTLYQAWEELGALQGRTIVNHEEFVRVQGPDGKTLVVYGDVDRLERHLRELAPEDGDLIGELVRGIRLMTHFGFPLGKPRELSNLLDKVKMWAGILPFLPTFMRYGKVSVQQFAARFKNPFLRESFSSLFDLPDFPLIAMMIALAWQSSRVAGYPIGGSLEFARAIERRFLDLGGEVSYRSRVEKILVEGDRAVGVRLGDGSEHRADVVVSAADGHATLFDMLDGKYLDDKIRGYYRDWQPFSPIIQVSLGLKMDLSSYPHQVVYRLPEPMVIGGREQREISLKHYCFDPTMAPAGKSVAVSIIRSEYDYWKKLRADRGGYLAEKQRVAEAVIGLLDDRIPGIRSGVEVVDVASPITYERYTGNWRGSMEGWLPTTRNMTTQISRSLPGLADFYMVGQWVVPGGGLPTGAMTARETVQVICARDGRPFRTSRQGDLHTAASEAS
ncbi:MAG TPA: NAD(P)/FAD-dependent oxidoreductase [Chloroflexota bacterium]|nr:NAD(P)/FAD-dependent oxidoreductase [Chloroflexota bacterium]